MSAAPSNRSRLAEAFDLIRRELLRFGVVGAACFVIEVGLFNLFLHTVLSDKVTTSKIIAATIATVCAWLGNRYYTFKHRATGAVQREVLLFFAANGLAIAVGSAWLAFTHYTLGYDTRLADNLSNLVGIAIGTLIRFTAYHFVVFAEVDPSTTDVLDPPA